MFELMDRQPLIDPDAPGGCRDSESALAAVWCGLRCTALVLGMGFLLPNEWANSVAIASCPAGETLKVVNGSLEFRDVTFAYPSRPGALVGPLMYGGVLPCYITRMQTCLCSESRQHYLRC